MPSACRFDSCPRHQGVVDIYGDSSSFIMGKVADINCLQCGEVFEAQLTEVRRGYAKFCGRSCAGIYNGKEKRRRLQIERTCEVCNNKFIVLPHQLKNRPCRTCSKSCAAVLKGGENPPNYQHGGYTAGGYRELALSNREPKCERCGWDLDIRGIVVHHIDRDRKNNSLDNLEVLCCSCHRVEHWEDTYGSN